MCDHAARPLVIQSDCSGRELESNRREIQLRIRKDFPRSCLYARCGLTARRSCGTAAEEKPIQAMNALLEYALFRIVCRHIDLKR